MVSKKNVSARGNRYSYKEKAKILSYVDSVNAEKGRGGAAAASRKFNISQITISQWVKKSNNLVGSSTSKLSMMSPEEFAENMARLKDVHEQIARKEVELLQLRTEYLELKSLI
ncbi:MAG: hypothetical protein ACSHX0_03515 [Akkermansiaceae bacterium]